MIILVTIRTAIVLIVLVIHLASRISLVRCIDCG